MIYKKSHGIKWLLSSLLHLSLIYKLYMFVRSCWNYITDMSYISETLYSKEFNTVLKRYLHTEFNKDWIGRLYGVVNPSIDINGKLDISGTIIEIDGASTNNIEYLKNWIFTQMQLISNLFKVSKLYDYIGVDIKHVGPINADNYLVVFDVVSRKETSYWMKRVLLQFIVYIVIVWTIFLTIL